MSRRPTYVRTIFVALSVLLNAILGGEPTETLSYRSAKAQRAGRRWGCLLCRLLDSFDADHCERSFVWWMRHRSSHEREGCDRDVS